MPKGIMVIHCITSDERRNFCDKSSDRQPAAAMKSGIMILAAPLAVSLRKRLLG